MVRDLSGLEIIKSPFYVAGKKSRLVGEILARVPVEKYGRWIEPFAGTCLVGMTERPETAVFSDRMPHIMRFFNAVKERAFSIADIMARMEQENALVLKNRRHYDVIRKRFDKEGDVLDFLYLSRACCNSVIRFAPNGRFNTRFGGPISARTLENLADILYGVYDAVRLSWEFSVRDYRDAFAEAESSDLLYADPPGMRKWEMREFREICRKCRCALMVTLSEGKNNEAGPEPDWWKTEGFEATEFPGGKDWLFVRSTD